MSNLTSKDDTEGHVTSLSSYATNLCTVCSAALLYNIYNATQVDIATLVTTSAFHFYLSEVVCQASRYC